MFRQHSTLILSHYLRKRYALYKIKNRMGIVQVDMTAFGFVNILNCISTVFIYLYSIMEITWQETLILIEGSASEISNF
jgi:hypothetical protein